MKVSVIGVAHKNRSTLLGSPYMEKELKQLGALLTQYPAGTPAQLEQAFREAAKQKEEGEEAVLLCPLSGNPQVDALCITQIGKLFGRKLLVDEHSASVLMQAGLSREEASALATLPQGAVIFPVKAGCTPGFELTGAGLRIIALPADQTEQTALFFSHVFPLFAKASPLACSCHIVRVMELELSQVEGALRDLLAQENPCIALYEKNKEIILRLCVTDAEKQTANTRCVACMREVIHRLGSYVYGVDVSSIEQALALKCAKKHLQVYFAESGTGGGAAVRMRAIPDGRSFVLSARSFQAEHMDLTPIGINEKICRKFDAVSANIAAAMALGASKQGSDSLIGIGLSLPLSAKESQSAYIAACMGENCLVQVLSVSAYPSVSAFLETAISLAMNLARKFADAYPAAPKGAVPAQDAVLQGMAVVEHTIGSGLLVPGAGTVSTPQATEGLDSKKAKPKGFQKILYTLFPNRDDAAFDKFRKIALLVCICVFCGSIFYLLDFGAQNKQSQENISGLQNEMQQAEKDVEEGKVNIDGYPNDYLPKFASFYKRNSDIKGWIKIPNTNVNFPVVQTSDNDYYHRLGFDKTYDYYGTPYLDFECDVKAPSTNLIIYGHNIKSDGQMFNDLTKYKQLNFYKENPVVDFDSVYKTGSYKIIGAFLTNNDPSHDNGNVFEYTHFVNTKDEKEFNDFVGEVQRRSIFDTPVDTKYGDQLLTLSTCSYEFKEARFVVVARRVRDGEDKKVDTTKAIKNEDAYYPAVYADSANYAKQLGKVKSIAISGSKTMALQVGETGSFTAQVSPSTAPIASCSWDSSNKTVATVDKKSGLVSAIGPGEAVITAVSDDGGFVDSAKVTVTGSAAKEEAKKIALDSSALSLKPGASKTLSVSLTPPDSSANLSWRSSDDTIVKVAGNNKSATLTAVNAGSAKVTVTSSDGKLSAVCTVKVSSTVSSEESKGPSSITFAKGSLNLVVGTAETIALTSAPLGTKPDQITYSWDGGESLKYSGNGTQVTLTPLAAGKGTLTATTDTGLTTSCSIVITAPSTPENNPPTTTNTPELSLTDLSLSPGQEGQIQHSVTPSNTKLVWSSSNPRIADVDENGYITTILSLDKTTLVTITAATPDGKLSKTATVTVLVAGTTPTAPDKNPDHSEKEDLKMVAEDTQVDVTLTKEIPIYITTKDSANISVECYSDNPSIASVSNDGYVTGVNPGIANITITATNHQTAAVKTATIKVTVIGGSVPVPGGTPTPPPEDQRN